MLTKNDMARVIIQALNNESVLPSSENVNVKRMATKSKTHIEKLHEKAVKSLQQTIE